MNAFELTVPNLYLFRGCGHHCTLMSVSRFPIRKLSNIFLNKEETGRWGMVGIYGTRKTNQCVINYVKHSTWKTSQMSFLSAMYMALIG